MKESMISVGIDIGTSTTQLVFCKMIIENTASAWTVPTVKIVDKEVLFRSDIYFTPLKSSDVIDAEAVKQLVLKIYEQAQMQPEAVDTGAVIITGETARKENAKEVLEMLSGLAGDFVVATAGPDLEGILAGKGSGACAYSKAHSCTVMNFDIGGGTTNVAIYKNGDVIDAACYDIGGRLIKVDKQGKIDYLSEKVKALSAKMALPLVIGQMADVKDLKRITDTMAEVMVSIAERRNGAHIDLPSAQEILITNHDLKTFDPIEAVFFSGGVADCMIETTKPWHTYGDIGFLLGESIRIAFEKTKVKAVHADETIRATVIGAGTHTTDISGSTIHYDRALLPIQNIPIIRLTELEEKSDSKARVEAITSRVKWFISQSDQSLMALSLRGHKSYGFDALQALASDIVKGMRAVIEAKLPLIILVDQDLAKSLGLSIRGNLSPEYPVICIDSVSVDNGDYIDIGVPVADGQVVPVIIKTLLFGY
ncbi:ethanolamine ammonia-lyase reactivating factor EutA [Fusibacter sp. 3D3]|uniref:ethanolamine ammonia-lyase reactivating factor EutA n=1 Tax=Fusibacter sp. 3D3 TaxID=1048380 RepID=UPI00085328CA|nr:ethanolamine ammonia-lyase reactivating factor EutA [Fusibacter sp. 3D3]GAU75895.1 ethanolamine utilization protein EutA [Fusibacter sp. 3D3]